MKDQYFWDIFDTSKKILVYLKDFGSANLFYNVCLYAPEDKALYLYIDNPSLFDILMNHYSERRI